MQPVKIIIADDHSIFRDGLKLLLKKLKGNEVEVIAEADNGEDLIAKVEAFKPDVVLTDIQMPVMNGIEATKILAEKFPLLGIIALSTFNDEGMVVDMLYAGARGYLLKNTNKEELLEAILKVYDGDIYYTAEILAHLTSRNGKDEPETFIDRGVQRLNEKEIEVIRHICTGITSKEVAAKMNLSKRTIEGYRDSIMKKIDAKNAIDIMAFAIRNKIYKV